MLSTQSLSQTITKRYILAVTILALLSTSVYIVFSYLIAKNQASAAVINISGQQRMLSQRAALFASQLVLAEMARDKKQIEQSLQETIAKMARNHQALTAGSADLNIPKEHSVAIENMYFGEYHLDQRVKKYLQSLSALLELEPNYLDTSNQHYLYIQRQFTPLLVDLDKTVSIYQKESEVQVEFIVQAEFILWLITLGILLLEVRLIFYPMNKEVKKALKAHDAYEARLQEEVDKQTKALKKANQQLNLLSNTDSLTGLRNRRSLEHKLKQFFDNYQHRQHSYVLAVIDLDHFKKLNDQYGHKCGDLVLKQVAKQFMEFFRTDDIIARFGGEEFVVLMPQCDIQQAKIKIEKLLEQLSNTPIFCDKQAIITTFSAGLAEAKLIHAENEYDIFKYADQALYQAKALGRQQVQLQHNDKIINS